MAYPPILLAVALHGGDCVTQPGSPSPATATCMATATPAPTPAVAPPPAPQAATSAPATAAAAPLPPPAIASATPPPPAAASLPLALPPAVQPGTIVVSGVRYRGSTTDPLEGANKVAFAVVTKADDLFVAPITHVYTRVLPKPLRQGLHNILNLLEEPTVFVNDLLQLHPGRAAKTLVRTTVNIALGWGGLFDVSAKVLKMPFRDNGFANTMGYYGVKSGPYLVAPLFGATTVRDLAGRIMDLSLLSSAVGYPFSNPTYGTVRGALASVDYRAEVDQDFKRIRAQSNPYLALKEYYLSLRQAEIDELHGRKIKLPTISRDSVMVPVAPGATVGPNRVPASSPLVSPAPTPPGAALAPQPAPALTPPPPATKP